MNEYCTLAQLRDHLASSDIDQDRGDDARLRGYIRRASRRIERHCNDRLFYPRLDTQYFNYQSAYELILNDDLLEVSSLTAGGTSISASNYYLYPLNKYPKWKIEMDLSGSTIFDYSSTLQKAVTVVGTWGWHDDWDNAWQDTSDTVEDNPLTAGASTITVNNIAGDDAYGFTPRFAPGHLLKIESEYIAVTAVNWTDETLTVIRGVNGTTAAEHVQNTTIYTYRPAEIVVEACLDLAKLYYDTRSAKGSVIALPGMESAVIRVSAKSVLEDHKLPVRPEDRMRFV
jgi:hypothetical protein